MKFFDEELNPIMVNRKQLISAVEEKSAAEKRAVTNTMQPIALIFDDYDAFAKTMVTQTSLLTWMQKINRIMAGRRLYFILTMSHRAVNRSLSNEFIQDVARAGVGIALGGSLADADPWSAGSVTTRRQKFPVGECFFLKDGDLRHAVLPEMTEMEL